ncbi:MAG: exonuclease domain-containing protein [Vicingaceae bacterium]
MYAIVDIETTGGRSRGDKITEIAIVLHDGEKVTEEFSSLIDPETKILYRITQITGIDNKTVAGAPKFYEVAKRVFQMTENRIFVAHNVSFDYNFIRAEFESLGGEFKRKKLCTVQMSRKLIPGKRSYSLGNLCSDLGIENEARHRALGDAKATAKLFDHLLSLDGVNRENLFSPNFLRKMNTVVDLDMIRELPESTGVYYFFNKKDELIYVGKSIHIKSRVIDHLGNNASKKAIEMKNMIHRIEYEETGSELVALLKESNEIKRNQPLFNRSQRRTYYAYGITESLTNEGYRRLSIERLTEDVNPLISFSTKMSARSYLYRLIERHELCQGISGLYPSSGPCFHFTIRQCRGACIGEEPADEFNYRVNDAVNELTYVHRDFIILDKGRKAGEKSVILVEKGVYRGFGYVLEESDIGPDDLRDRINHYEDNRDVQQIIRSYLHQKKVEKIMEL